MSNYHIGCDPDTHSTALTITEDSGQPLWVGVARVDKQFKDHEAVKQMACQLSLTILSMVEFCQHKSIFPMTATVEAQEIVYTSREGKNPRSVLFVGNVAGCVLYALQSIWPVIHLVFPVPARWKGSAPKRIHQSRIMSRLGWDYATHGSQEDGYCSPILTGTQIVRIRGADLLKRSDWKHMNDAIGLSHFGKKEYEEAAKIQEFKKSLSNAVS